MKGGVQFNMPKNLDGLTPYEQSKKIIEAVLDYEKRLKKELAEMEKFKMALMRLIVGIEGVE